MMASLLALSMLWILPSSQAWMPAPVVQVFPSSSRSATTNASQRWRNKNNNHLLPLQPRSLLLASSSPTAVVTNNESKESLDLLTVPELKERLKSTGQKVSGNKSQLVERLLTHQQSNGRNDDDTSNNTITDVAENNKLNLDPSVAQMPDPLIEAITKFAASASTTTATATATTTSSPKLLPIQQKSYQIISSGRDAVLFSPTGTGKTLAYILPLAARLHGWKHDGVSLQHKKDAQKKRFIMQQRRRSNTNDSLARSSSSSSSSSSFSQRDRDVHQPVDAAEPSILVLEPSRELARQVGKVWGKFHPTATKTSRRQVVTVFGGVPMARHAAMLGGKTDVVVGTPGRIRELIREKYLSTAHIRSIVLDEADTLLNFGDNPEVEWLLDGMQNDYQLVLASATINKRVEKFVGEVMELEVGEEGYVVVDDGDYGVAAGAGDDAYGEAGGLEIGGVSGEENGIQIDEIDSNVQRSTLELPSNRKPVVHHWSMAASATSRTALTSDLIVTMAPRRGVVFVPSKAEVEVVARELSERLSTANDVTVHILHGDMAQAARSRTVTAFRGDSTRMTRVLVATDVASRGLDLPAVDLVLQYGVPRKTGKDGTYDSELYVHRTGRAGRFGNTRDHADAILLYDRSQGEGTTLPKLQEEMENLQGIQIKPRKLPSPSEVMEASYDRAFRRCEEFGSSEGAHGLVRYFAGRLSEDMSDSVEESAEDGANNKESLLMHRLATAMAALSGLEEVVPPRSLLTSNPKDRTIRVWRNDDKSTPLTPPEVTKMVKSLGSGKLGRISICSDGSAVFDLGAKKAELLLKNAGAASDDDESRRVPGGNLRCQAHSLQYRFDLGIEDK